MAPLKPPRGAQLNRTHPLARSLGACWLLNEGSGAQICDLTGNGWTGTLQGTASWVEGEFGSALYCDGDNDCVETSSPVVTSAPVSVSLWFRADELPSVRAQDGTLLVQRTVGSPYQSFRTLINDSDDKILLLIYNSSGVNTVNINSDSAIQTHTWYHVVFILDSDYDASMYVNGVQQAGTGNSGSLYSADDVLRLGSRTGTADDFKGRIDLLTIFSRSLSDAEVTLLYRDPFCLFEAHKSIDRILSAPTMVSLAGSTSAKSAALGTLESFLSSPATERDWLRGALFNGVTPNAFRLGTTLSLGWFWLRTTGCSAFYRGSSIEQIDFERILAIVPSDANSFSPVGYVRHDFSSTYFYVVRRFNCCGYQERTLGATAKVAIGPDGRLLEPRPNSALMGSAERAAGNRIQLEWFYCPLDQKSHPSCFNVYYDNGTGQIDCQTPLASINYQGPRFYRYHCDTLGAGRYLFVIRVEGAGGVESSSSVQLAVQVSAASPAPIEMLSAGCL